MSCLRHNFGQLGEISSSFHGLIQEERDEHDNVPSLVGSGLTWHPGASFWPRLTLEVLVICFGAFAMISGIFALVVALGDRKMHAG